MIVLAAGLGIVSLTWALVAGPEWIRRTSAAGGHWALAGIIYLSGPINELIQLTYPNGANPAGFGLLLARANTVASWSLGVIALLAAVRIPRRGRAIVITGVVAFYGTHLLSSAFGYLPAPPREEYFVTPLLVVPFLLHGGYDWRWLAGVLRRALRAIVVLSLIAVVLLPSIAYNQTCCRQIFGIERIQGITGHPNTLAILACFAVILELRGGRLPWLVPHLLAMLLAQSTTAWIALALGLLVLAGRLGSSARVIALAVGLGAILLAVTDPNVVNAFFPPEFWTFTGRTTIWQAALQGFFLNPGFGYGPTFLDEQYRSAFLGSFDAAGQAHNQFVQTLGGTGLVGLIFLIVLLLLLIRDAARASAPTGGLSVALLIAFSARLLSETPLTPQGSTATLLLVIAVVGITASGAPVPRIDVAPPVQVRTTMSAPHPPTRPVVARRARRSGRIESRPVL